ncbi:maleylpyruvate isomerase family mycothiol-dependent enzyme [Nocardioides pantholopis]|uniref:maleylpyruvate isomerase family mycothiol-dependent enzyme n=1 Tax=Nocardioides pantholopis TaxID=2483798 RepID=UPI000FDAF557|nr:maleylpyruvate isomerase family mycothiol-dependent enzyme [Nocardioides pantholopis]
MDATAQDRLAGHVEVWWQAVESFTRLLEQVPDEQWSAPTDLPGWDVRAVAAHTAHLESVLATGVEETAEIGEPAHVTGSLGRYTEIGVVNRRTASPAAILEEIRGSTAARHAALLADPPADADARPERIFGGVPWSWETLLRNRPLDIWMHEQDVRRAVGRPGGLDTAAARHTADYLAEGLGYVLARKAGAPAGTTVVLDLAGSAPYAFAVTDAGRGERLPAPPPDPTVRLGADRETYVLLAGGRRPGAAADLTVEGDAELGRLLVANLATTP